MEIKGVGIGRGVAVGSVIRMAAPLPEPSDAPRADTVPAQGEIDRVTKSLAVVNADLSPAMRSFQHSTSSVMEGWFSTC